VAHWNTFRSATARRPGSDSGRTHRDKIRGCFRFRGSARRASRGTPADERRIVIAGASLLTRIDTATCDGDLRGLA